MAGEGHSMAQILRPSPYPLPAGEGSGLHRFALLTACFTALLIFVGGLVTSTESGLSVPDWPTTYGWNMFTFPFSKWVGGIFYEHSHRMLASFVGFLTVILTLWTWLGEKRAWVKWLSAAALSAVILQGVLGGITVLFLLPAPISTLHACLAQTFFCLVIAIAVFTSPQWKRGLPFIGSYAETSAVPALCAATTAAVYVQLVLGALTVWTKKAIIPTTAHVLIGALVLGSSFLLTLRAYAMVTARGLNCRGAL